MLAGHQLPVTGLESLLQLAGQIEGHPDNVAPAIYGGLRLGIHTGERWMTKSMKKKRKKEKKKKKERKIKRKRKRKKERKKERQERKEMDHTKKTKKKDIRIPAGLQIILFVPDRVCETSVARALLSNKVPFSLSFLFFSFFLRILFSYRACVLIRAMCSQSQSRSNVIQ